MERTINLTKTKELIMFNTVNNYQNPFMLTSAAPAPRQAASGIGQFAAETSGKVAMWAINHAVNRIADQQTPKLENSLFQLASGTMLRHTSLSDKQVKQMSTDLAKTTAPALIAAGKAIVCYAATLAIQVTIDYATGQSRVK